MNDYEMFKNLLVMAAADESFSEEEIVYLSQRANRLGISEEQFQEALDQVLGRGMLELTIPPDDAERRRLLKELLQIMGADGHLVEVERQLFANVAAHMMIEESELNLIIDSLK